MDTLGIVEALDVATERCVELSVARKPALMNELGFEGMEEALHMEIGRASCRERVYVLV